jgi:hypothetical protein
MNTVVIILLCRVMKLNTDEVSSVVRAKMVFIALVCVF